MMISFLFVGKSEDCPLTMRLKVLLLLGCSPGMEICSYSFFVRNL